MKITVGKNELEVAAKLLKRKYIKFLKDDEKFTIDTWVEGGYIYLKTLLSNSDKSFYYPVYARINIEKNKILRFKEGFEALLDFIDYYFSQYLMDERQVLVPIDYDEIQFVDYVIEVKGQEKNLKLEEMADKILSGEITDFSKLDLK